MTEQEPRIFLCHAKEDKQRVKELYRQLKAAGYHPWLDEEDLLPGADWELEIRRAIRSSVLFLACLSPRSVNRKGYVHKEIKMALDELDQMPEGNIYLIPVRLEECQVPDRLQSRQWVDLFAAHGFGKLKRALESELGKPKLPFEPELILIPAGEFLMGSDPSMDEDAHWSEQPQHTLYLPDYHIARTPVTNAQYATFLEATGHEAPYFWRRGKQPLGKDNHPVVAVSWHDALAYCRWLAKITDKPYRLPTEAEWEKAARGTDGRIYPWGDDPPDENRCNFDDSVEDTTSVAVYSPRGDSPYGCVDMAGNVWEWCQSLFKPYKYDPNDGREDPKADGLRVFRGGSYQRHVGSVRCASRVGSSPRIGAGSIGFRVVVAPGFASGL